MTYRLENEELEVNFSLLGGTLCSIKDKRGLEYMWQGDKTYWSGTAPILFPICGSIRNDTAYIGEGKETKMPRHGIVRKQEFVLKEKNKTSIQFYIESDEKTLEKFPYEFKLNTKYELKEKSVVVTYEVENKSTKDMPFFIGGHPGFNCPLVAGESYEDYYIEFDQKEDCSVPTPVTETGLIDMEHRIPCLKQENTIQLTHELFRKDAIILDELKSRKVRVLSKKSMAGVELKFEDFPYLILWSSNNDGPFIAIEPWVGLSTCSDESDIFEEKRNVQILKPQEKTQYTYTITVI